MRSYIFTSLERERIRGFLEGKTPANDAIIAKVRFRVRAFKNLAGDVDLYLRLREAISTVSA